MQKPPANLTKFFFFFLKKQWPWFLLLQIFYFTWAIDHTLFPYLIGWIVDSLSQLKEKSQLWSAVATPLILGASLWIGIEISYRIAGFLNSRVTPRFEAQVRMAMFEYAQRHSYGYFTSHLAGSLANKIADMPASMTRILQMVMTLFMPVLAALAISVGLFAHLQPWFAILIIAWIVIHISICLLFAKKCSEYANIHAETRSTLAGKIVDNFTNHLNVRLFARHRFEKDYLLNFQKEEIRTHTISLAYIEKMKIGLGIAAFLGPGVAINWLMLYSWQQGTITTGDVVFIFNTTWNIMMMAWLAGLEIPNFFREIGICKQALTILKDPHDVVDSPDAKSLIVSSGQIVFENVTFHYTPNHIVFRNKNIVLDAGSKVGLVGFSGSGKSTFVHLILRYFDVEDGRILIDNQDIALVTQDSLYSQIAMIPQDTTLLHRTLMENIRYGNPEATDEEVYAASKQARCHEFIEKLPDKYNTLAGERGVKISGGQRQRIAIARAILKNAPILILDEATSALDSVTEQHIQETLHPLIQGRTTLVIAHRLSTLSGMDRILVFKDGKIIEDGSHDELLQACGHYANLWDMQAGGFLPDTLEDE